jgi:nitrite reductase/ring-hydroxylating ferredoxin subunit
MDDRDCKQADHRAIQDSNSCDCRGSNQTRRDFIANASSLAFFAIIAAGVAPENARSFPVSLISAASSEENEVAYPIPNADGASIDAANQIILVRSAGQIYAFALACPHENTALRWRAADNRFQCPRHQSKYRPDGVFLSGRATRNMDRFQIQSNGQKILVAIKNVYRSDKQNAEWQAAVVRI